MVSESVSGEPARLAALRRFAILDTAPEAEYDAVAAVARQTSGMAAALVTFVDATRVWFKARVGYDQCEASRDESFCSHVVADPSSTLVVADAWHDPRFAHSALAKGDIRAYVGVPLVTAGGLAVGALCAFDSEPRRVDPTQVASLEALATVVMAQLERTREAALTGALTCVVDYDGYIRRVSAAWQKLLGWTPEQMVGRQVGAFIHPDDLDRSLDALSERGAGGPSAGVENRYRTSDGSYRWLLWTSQRVPEERLLYAAARDITSRKEAELRLAASEAFKSAVLESAHDALVCVDPDGRIAEANAAAERTFGCPRDALVGRPLTALAAASSDATLAGVAAGDQALLDRPLTLDAARLDGPRLRIELSATRVGADRHIACFIRDVSEREAAQAALVESEARYRLLTENATDMISSHSSDGSYRYASAACAALLGYRPEELIGRSAYELIVAGDLAAVTAAHAELRAGDTTGRVAYRLRRKDGTAVWVESVTRALRNDDGEIVEIQCATRDISAAVATRERLVVAEERFRRAFDAAPIGMAIIDFDGTIEQVNPAFCEFLGYEADTLTAHGVEAITHPADHADDVRRLTRLICGDARSDTVEKRYIDATGSVVWGLLTVSLIRDSADQPLRVLAQVQDIGQRKRAAAEAAAARTEAERANRAKSEFLSRMSHELRTPLNAVLGFAQLLQLDELTGEQKDGVSHIEAAGRHLLGLIDEVLDISRIEAGRLEVAPELISIERPLLEAIGMIRPLAADRAIEIDHAFRTAAGLLVRADYQRIKQVLVNLLSNAVKYGPADSTVTVEAVVERPSRLRIAVIDTGPGIDDADLPRLFEPFERLSASQAVEGTGLGLALSKHLMEAMGGELLLDQGDGRTVFSAMLPLAEHETVAEPAIKLIYVDDDAGRIDTLQQATAETGDVELLACTTPALAASLAVRERASALLVDADRGDAAVDAVVAAARSDAPTVPVIALADNPQAAARAVAAGAATHVEKPLVLAQLQDCFGR